MFPTVPTKNSGLVENMLNSWLERLLRNAGWHDEPHNSRIMAFLSAKFQGHIISCKAMVAWSSYSPDLNPLDFFFWFYAMIYVCRQKPATTDELKKTVKDIASTVPEQMIQNAMGDF